MFDDQRDSTKNAVATIKCNHGVATIEVSNDLSEFEQQLALTLLPTSMSLLGEGRVIALTITREGEVVQEEKPVIKDALLTPLVSRILEEK